MREILEVERVKYKMLNPQVKPVEEAEKLVVHNKSVGIQYPQNDGELFAIVEIAGTQFKVV